MIVLRHGGHVQKCIFISAFHHIQIEQYNSKLWILPSARFTYALICVNSGIMTNLYCSTNVHLPAFTRCCCWDFKIVNTCLTELDSQPPFESALHSQLWAEAHRGSLKHLQSWNCVWDLYSDYTGTSGGPYPVPVLLFVRTTCLCDFSIRPNRITM